ncbi:hypothetical protein [Rufibacter hautae]|nr:hypothetical protein [Rufibacter hautae]
MDLKSRVAFFLSGALLLGMTSHAQLKAPKPDGEKTAFQIADAWAADYDVRSDVAIVYGINDAGGDFEGRVKSWRDKGYKVHFMTGIAWGEYQDYFTGKYDGKTHWEDGQVMKNGETIWHGKDVPYVVPSATYLTYMKELVKRAIDAGVTAVHLEEPEFWARAGYGPSFKKEWEKQYGFPWIAQDESPEATYLSSKLKYQLYFNALKEVFAYVRSYSQSKGVTVKCYVPTHSLINYSSWAIVSPEASLANLEGMDGYIAQVWTGTSREPIHFNGVLKERVFENAFLEYGSMVSMTAPTGRKMFFLTDPIEDRRQTWDDYKRNYEATFTAQLLYPMVASYEVMPWPKRIYLGKFKMENSNETQPIPRTYATQMQVMVNSLNDMPLSSNQVSGTKGIDILLANSMMFQRFPTHKGYEDPQLSNFYGMVMPLLKQGIPVGTVHMENLGLDQTLKNTKVLIMSYANMKPMSPVSHEVLAKWVKNGGVLVYVGRDQDPFQTVKEWWNTGGKTYKAPSEHLLEQLGIKEASGKQSYAVGKGKLYLLRRDPKELVLQASQDADFISLVKNAYETDAKAGKVISKNHFLLQRGPYDIAAVLDESVGDAPLRIQGPVVDLFDPALPVLPEKVVKPGQQAYLYNLTRLKSKKEPVVLCAASRVYEEKKGKTAYSFLTKSPSNTRNAMRMVLPAEPKTITLTDAGGQKLTDVQTAWHKETNTYLVQFENDSKGIRVEVNW